MMDFDTDVELDKLDGGQTNDEWRKTCSAEEFAEWVSDIIYGCKDGDCMACKGIGWCSTQDVIEWLKQPHREE